MILLKISLLVMAKGIVMAVLIIGVAEASLVDGIIIALVSATANGIILFLITRYGTKHVEKKVDEVKEHIEEKANGNG